MKNVLLIGLGNIGKVHYKNLSRFKNYNIYVFDKDNNLTSEFINRKIQNETKLEEILNNNEIDAAIIASPSKTHADISKMLSTKSIPHLIEKPICLSKNDYLTILNTAKTHDVFVMCGFVERFHESIVVLKNKINKQQIINFSSVRNSIPPSKNRELDDVKFDVLIHDLDLFYFLVEDVNYKYLKISENENFTNANYIDDDTSATFTANRVSHKKRREINIITNKYEYHVDLIQNKIIKYKYKYYKNSENFSQTFIKTNEEVIYVDPTESIFNELEYFFDNIKLGFKNDLFKSYQFSHYALFNKI